ncbi:type I polyketide synthase [Aspergillus novofumigatus IBT 16806]|uniref:Melanin synthase n=1 Tax=Aspergillus novofumigatus (strain IBT 16806) TaxID=1392255 RepID=A0A2I1BSU7_ASPN1|nr:melanin synthase [Aspergillus novofumigatus IBT 16806]PKX88468.1 melanin synthase [Aspergillus novofumigatus IBT 16806]
MHRPLQVERLNLVVLGDQTNNVSPLLKKLLLSAPHSVAQSEFIRDASAALRAQSDRLRPFQREHLPGFKSIHDLARIYEKSNGVCHPSISSALLCVTQLLQIFRYFEGRGRRPEQNEHIAVVGLCTGSLVAAAYATSASLDDLKLLAVPTVSMAFQMGLQAATASSMLHEQGNPLGSWSIAIPKMTEDEALSALKIYDAGGHLSLRHRCFVSAVGLKSVTISGSPPALSRFAESLTASQPSRKIIWLPIFAGYHASHIHTVLDFPSFLSRCGIDADLLSSFKSIKTLLSPLTGEPVDSNSALDLFKTVVHHTLQAPLRLDLIVDRCASLIRENTIASVRIDAVGPTPVADSLAAALRNRTSANISTRELVVLEPGVDQYKPSAAFSQAPLAIVGMSGRFPGAESAEALWSLLESGLDLHRVIPKDRFDVEKHVDPTGKAKNTSWTPYGCFIDRPGEFDPRFFNMSPREALQTDPMQRLALVTAYEALEMSGFVPDRTRSTALSRVGTFYGQTSDDYRDVNAAQDIGTYFITGGIRAFGPGRINYFFKFGGPSYSVDTACSSSLAAIQLACTALRNGECDTAVAGGLSVLTSPDLFSGLSRGQFLSKTGSCKTFDDGADGYCRADGIGSVVIKRLTDAELDRDNVLAVILGAGTNHSANAISITHPHAETQSNLYRHVLGQSGVDPLDVGYIEMHGTGTQAGDGTEMRSVVDVFGPERPSRAEDNPLYVGAVKANIGHGEASSGVASLIKAILIFKHSAIPPHIGIKNAINRGFPDLNARKANELPKGGNTALLIQEAPTPVVQHGIEPRPLHPVTVSGHTKAALSNNLDKLIAYLSANPNTSPVDLSYTTTARRRHHGFRVSVAESSTEQLRIALEQKKHSVIPGLSTPPVSRPVVFVFTGQGAAYPALARELYTMSSQFRADIDHFDGIARQQGFPSFLSIIDGTAVDLDLLSPIQTQIGLVCIQVALARLWNSLGIKPDAVVGHSLGEYAALQVSGVLSISDTIYLVGYRARLLESRCEMHSHAMLAVADSTSVLQTVPAEVSSRVEIACVNSPRETVFSGEKAAIDDLEAYLAAKNIRSTKLQVPYAFHSAQVDPILHDLEEVAKVVNMGTPHCPFISSLKGLVLGPGEQIDAQYLRQHCRQAVQFSSAVRNARDVGLVQESTIFIEIGPHPICSRMVRSNLGDPTQTLPTLRRKENPWKVIVGSLTSLHDMGFSINWSEYHRDIEGACRLLTLPAYSFENKNYWVEYRNDWTLRKGDPWLAVSNGDEDKPVPKLSSSVHRVLEENYKGANAIAVFETDLSAPEIHAAISGHRVNGSALCPSSMYADVALTVARHIQQKPESGFSSSGHNITAMEVQQPLIVKTSREEETRVLRIYARVDRPSQIIKVEYVAASPGQKAETKHATCCIEFGSPEKWLRRWSHDLYLIQDRVAALQKLTDSGEVSKITSRLAYRLFASLVDYAPQYQRMDQVLLASNLFEATATVKLDDRGDDATFVYSPYWIDALLHLSGFVMNGNDTLNYNEAVYISHGWESLRFAKPLNPQGHYQAYVRMLPRDKTMVGGNVWILCDGEVVGLAEDLRFQRVPRTVLDMLLPPVGVKRTAERQLPKAVPQKPLPKRPTPSSDTQLAAVSFRPGTSLDIISAELGLEASDISPHDRLSDLGVDSLMSLTLASNLTEQLAITISHSELMDCNTISELLAMLDQKQGGTTSPLTNSSAESGQDSGSSYEASDSSQSSAMVETFTPDSAISDTAELVRSIISDETGIPTEDLESSADLSALGVDSLMSLAVLARLQEVGVELPTDFFLENNTMNEVFRALPRVTGFVTPRLQGIEKVEKGDQKLHAANHNQTDVSFRARVVLLQKRSNPTSTGNFFLFPDGSGSPFSYAALEPISPDFDIYGLVCPFIDSPMTILAALKQQDQQPHGPYHFGGWSVGGVLAYEASRQLIEAKQKVQSLILIDAPCPAVLPPMSSSLIDYLASKGVFGQSHGTSAPKAGEKRQSLLKHFDSTVANLALYKPRPIIPLVDTLETLIIWARDGVNGDSNVSESSNSTESWILDNRSDFGPHGWETVLPAQHISTVPVSGNHFTMMAGQNAVAVSSHLQNHFAGFA